MNESTDTASSPAGRLSRWLIHRAARSAPASLARAGSGHYRATTEDGRPVNACYAFRVRFQLKN